MGRPDCVAIWARLWGRRSTPGFSPCKTVDYGGTQFGQRCAAAVARPRFERAPHGGFQLARRGEFGEADADELVHDGFAQGDATGLRVLAEPCLLPVVEAILGPQVNALAVAPDVGRSAQLCHFSYLFVPDFRPLAA